MIKIVHVAHACFIIKNGEEKVIIDPYDDSLGYPPVKEETHHINYILASHNHYDHNYTENISLLENTGTFKIQKINSFHDNEKGKLRGENIIHVIETYGIRVCHLGDLGHLLEEEQLKEIGNIDILLVPVGGTYTIDCKEAVEVVKQINPVTVIPMHYKTEKINLNIGPVDDFIGEIEEYYEVVRCNENYLNYVKTDEKKVYMI